MCDVNAPLLIKMNGESSALEAPAPKGREWGGFLGGRDLDGEGAVNFPVESGVYRGVHESENHWDPVGLMGFP